ncbi:MAG TPA: tagatose-bisphosphate aldolase, partial [Clostridiales bacterium]|nr:tagatose-bisphosphate aldolase [Clostridiales bacterium]
MFQFFDTSDLKNDEIALRLVQAKPEQPEKGYVPAYLFDICLPDGT